MKALKNVASGWSTVRELMQFLRERQLWWLMPFVVTLLIVGVLLLVGEVTGVAPFIYTLF
jgi:hypothetical protein